MLSFATFFSLYLWPVHFLICFLFLFPSSLSYDFSHLLLLSPNSPLSVICHFNHPWTSILLHAPITLANNLFPWNHCISNQYRELYCVIHLRSFARLICDCTFLLNYFLLCSCRSFSRVERSNHSSNPMSCVWNFIFYICFSFFKFRELWE